MRSGEGTRRLLATRIAVTLAAVTPPLLAILAGFSAAGLQRHFACWFLPNGHVLVLPGHSRCPLGLQDRVRAVANGPEPWLAGRDGVPIDLSDPALVRVLSVRDSREVVVEIPIRTVSTSVRASRTAASLLAIVALLGIPVFVLWRTESKAAVPFVVLYSAVAVVSAAAIGDSGAPGTALLCVLSMWIAPAALAHLALTLPVERRVLREAPAVALVPYAIAALLLPYGWLALYRDPLLWPPFVYVLVAATLAAWTLFMLSCGLALRHSRSALERARARVLLVATPLLPALPALLWPRQDPGAWEAASAYLWSAACLMPLPLGLAVSRYNLFDLGWDVRLWVGRLVYSGLAAIFVVSILHVVGDSVGHSAAWEASAVGALGVGVCVLALESWRGQIMGIVDSMLSPRVARLRDLREQHARETSQLRDPDAIAAALGAVIRRGLDPLAASIHLASDRGWRASHRHGPTAQHDGVVPQVEAALAGRAFAHILLDPVTPAGEALQAAGIEAVAAIDHGTRRFGLLLAGRRKGAAYSGAELDFVAIAAAHAGSALRNAQLTEELLAAERRATTGRLSVALAHDLGKELDWLSRLARRLPKRLDDPVRLARDAVMIQEFTDALILGVRRFVIESTRSSSLAPGTSRLDVLVQGAARRMERIHGVNRITQVVDPAVRSAPCAAELGRAIGNLLDNALHAAPAPDPVHLFATLEEGWIRVAIVDRGPGPPLLPDGPLGPGRSARWDRGGLGMGLPLAREIVRSLGGEIDLAPDPGGGTRATLRVPVNPGEAACVRDA